MRGRILTEVIGITLAAALVGTLAGAGWNADADDPISFAEARVGAVAFSASLAPGDDGAPPHLVVRAACVDEGAEHLSGELRLERLVLSGLMGRMGPRVEALDVIETIALDGTVALGHPRIYEVALPPDLLAASGDDANANSASTFGSTTSWRLRLVAPAPENGAENSFILAASGDIAFQQFLLRMAPLMPSPAANGELAGADGPTPGNGR